MISIVPIFQPSPGADFFVGEIKNLDLNKSLSDADFGQIVNAWSLYPVLVLRDQDIDAESHQAFAGRFGELATRVRPLGDRGKNVQNNSHLMLVSNIRDEDGVPIGSDGEGALPFHSDGCFNETPSMASFLYGIEVPESGGNTLFVSMYQVYNELSGETRNKIMGESGVNYYFYEYSKYNKNGGELGGTREPRSKAVRNSIHPMIIAHPVTRKPVVFANRHFTREIVGMDLAKAKPLLREIFRTVERPDMIYAHHWQKGDLVIWDNRAVQHARTSFSPKERRLLRRFAVLCKERPQAFNPTAMEMPIT